MYSEPSSGIKLTAYSCICWLFHRIHYDAWNYKHKILSHSVTQSGLLTALSNTQQTNIQKIDIMYICAHLCSRQSQSKGKTAQKKKQSVAGNYVTVNKVFSPIELHLHNKTLLGIIVYSSQKMIRLDLHLPKRPAVTEKACTKKLHT